MTYTKKQLLVWIDEHMDEEDRFAIGELLTIPSLPTAKMYVLTKIIENLNNADSETVTWIADCLDIEFDLSPYTKKATKPALIKAIVSGLGFDNEDHAVKTMRTEMALD